MSTDDRPLDQPITRRQALTVFGAAGASLAGLAACSDDETPAGTSPQGTGDADRDASGKATVEITAPADGAKDVPASTEIVFAARNAVDTKVELVDSSGTVVEGAMHPDGGGFLPSKSLDYGANYTATVTATDTDGKAATAKTTFATMAKPANIVSVSSFLADDAVVGVGMPLIFRTSRPVDEAHRAAVQRRLLVQTQPAQEGIWTWYNASELHWRPRQFWKAGTRIFVNARTGGLPLGDGSYGRRDLTLTCSVGPALIMTVDDKASPKVMKVVRDGVLLRSIPVSLGRPGMPSSSGTTVVIERLAKTIFDTMDDPNPANRYRTPIEYAQRLTWGGEFIHAAPWSVADQGRRNVSHGCINMSTENAKWLFEQTHMGDPVVVKGTSRKLEWNNGWTDWDRPWEEYVKGSAIPYAAPPSAAPSPTG